MKPHSLLCATFLNFLLSQSTNLRDSMKIVTIFLRFYFLHMIFIRSMTDVIHFKTKKLRVSEIHLLTVAVRRKTCWNVIKSSSPTMRWTIVQYWRRHDELSPFVGNSQFALLWYCAPWFETQPHQDHHGLNSCLHNFLRHERENPARKLCACNAVIAASSVPRRQHVIPSLPFTY